MKKPIPLIEYQGRQRTPQEVIDRLQEEVKDITRIFVIYHDGRLMSYMPGSINRDYRKSDILWDVTQWKVWFLEDEND